MSTNLIIGIVAALAVVGGGVYVATNPEIMASISGGMATTTETGVENENEGGASVGSTFAELIALGQSVVCTFTHDDGGENRSSGTVYMTGGGAQIRGDFVVESPVASSATFVRTGGYNYMWGPDMPQGIKTRVTNETELMEGGQGGIDPNTEFACQAWTVDNSRFTVPTTIQFMEVNANVNVGAGATVGGSGVSGSASGSASVKAQQCASCNMIPDAAAKAQCLAALAC